MNSKLLIGVVVLLVVVGGGYFLVKSLNPSAPMQQQAAPTATPASPTSTQTQNAVTLTQNGWSPAVLTIKPGATVTWTNKSGEDATVNSNPHPTHTDYPPLNLGSFADGTSLTLTFPKPGTYGYHNHLNPSETGKIIVE